MAQDGPFTRHAQVLLLLDGQDQIVSRLKAQREDIRQAVKAAKARIAQVERRIEEDQAALSAAEGRRRAGERELEALSKRIARTGAMDGVTTQKAWEAAQAELETLKASHARHEEEVLGAMEAIDALHASIADARRMLAAEESANQQLREEKKVAFDALGEELGRASAERQGLAAELVALDPGVASRYEALLKRHGDRAVTVADGERCRFCHLSLIPQHLLEVRLGKALHFCDHCGRFALPG